jgi:PAS domain S-box-containing protein
MVDVRLDPQRFFTLSIDLLCVIGLDGFFKKVNPAFTRALGYTERHLKARQQLEFVHPEDRDATVATMQRLSRGKPVQNFENRYVCADGSVRWLAWSSAPFREEGVVYAVGRDISHRKKAERQIRQALAEKEVLLREIHHRVKNNLQIISSLLSLQAAYVKDETAREILKESQNRVRSMAIVHEQLHRAQNLSKIDFAEYVGNLATGLFRSYGVDPAVVGLRLDVGRAELNIDTAIPCGLIIHELVSNSLKYAFPSGRKGWIHVSLRPGRDGLVLKVSDNGVGFPKRPRKLESASLGLRLVEILAEQIEGVVTRRHGRGAECRITFRGANHKEVG